MTDADHTAKIIALLAEHGIDASDVFEDGWDDDGYWEAVSNGEGHIIFEGATGSAKRRWRDWPEGFPVAELRRLFTLRAWAPRWEDL